MMLVKCPVCQDAAAFFDTWEGRLFCAGCLVTARTATRGGRVAGEGEPVWLLIGFDDFGQVPSEKEIRPRLVLEAA